jgi:uncharacterized protein
MKFLTFVDLHSDKEALKILLERASQDDIQFLICAGDFTNFGDNMGYILKKLNSLRKFVYLIPGNHETDEEINSKIAKYPHCVNINRKAIRVEDYVLLGYGEGGFSREDKEFRKLSRDWYGQYQDENIILITHGPPYGVGIDLVEGNFTGNKDYRHFAERIKPKLVISGHIHETAGKIVTFNEIKYVNPGWQGMVIELD